MSLKGRRPWANIQMEEIKKEKVIVGKIEKESGYLYYVDGEGNVWRAPLSRGGRKRKGN